MGLLLEWTARVKGFSKAIIDKMLSMEALVYLKFVGLTVEGMKRLRVGEKTGLC